jgi:SAM-dependent methyltransferase
MTTERKDTWAAGKLYEPYVGRWSRRVALRFLAWLQAGPDLEWLDVGCGTGALAQTVLEQARPRRVRGIDPSQGFVDYATAHVVDPRVGFEVGDAQSLPFADGEFDAAIAGLVLNFVPEPGRALAEMARVVRPAGTVAAYVWDYAGRMQLMRYFWDAATALDPAAVSLDEGRRFPLCQAQPLSALFEQAGLEEVSVTAIEVPTRFRDFDDYWSPFLGGQGPAPSYVASLPEAKREALRERLRAALPAQDDGAIALVARAWAVRGRVSG